jgi:hypothetical protein
MEGTARTPRFGLSPEEGVSCGGQSIGSEIPGRGWRRSQLGWSEAGLYKSHHDLTRPFGEVRVLVQTYFPPKALVQFLAVHPKPFSLGPPSQSQLRI